MAGVERKKWGLRIDPKVLEGAKACKGRLSLNAYIEAAIEAKNKQCKPV